MHWIRTNYFERIMNYEFEQHWIFAPPKYEPNEINTNSILWITRKSLTLNTNAKLLVLVMLCSLNFN